MISLSWMQGNNLQLLKSGMVDFPHMNGAETTIDTLSINYFMYHGQPSGFQYEFVKELSNYMGLELKINTNFNENLQTNIHEDIKFLINCNKYPKAKTNKKIKNQIELAGKTIYVPNSSSHAIRLNNLAEESQILFHFNNEGKYDKGNENNIFHNPEIDIKSLIGIPQNVAWAISNDVQLFRNEINVSMAEFVKTRTYSKLYNKYFECRKSDLITKNDFYYPSVGQYSKYDKILQQESEKINWDWRLLVSMIYQESRFKEMAVSQKGAFGLMQLMPLTAEYLGVDMNSSPEENIKAGVRFIKWLDDRFRNKIADDNERIKFVLASYNIGYGHIFDAIRLAEKNGVDAQKWENAEVFLLKKSEPEYYNDPVVRNGYCKGLETTAYVKEIMNRYEQYLSFGSLLVEL